MPVPKGKQKYPLNILIVNMQVFSLAVTLFPPSLKPEPAEPCHCSAEGAGLKGTFWQGRYFFLLVVGAVGSLPDLSGQPRCMATAQSGECVVATALVWWFQLVLPAWAAVALRLLTSRDSDWHSTVKGEMSCEQMNIKGAQGVKNQTGKAAVVLPPLYFNNYFLPGSSPQICRCSLAMGALQL